MKYVGNTLLLLSFLALTAFGEVRRPPEHPIDNWLYYEQLHNEMTNDTSVFAVLDMDSQLPPEYNPRKEAKFEIGYLEIPVEDMVSFEGSNLSRNAKKFLVVRRGGKNHYRYFIHPDQAPRLKKVIEKYGGLKMGEYYAQPTASPRSLVIRHHADPDAAIGMKVSLTRKIGGVSRLNPHDKLSRSHAINEAMADIPEAVKKRYGFSFMPESLQLETPGLQYGNIVRELDPKFLSGEIKMLPGFSLFSKGPDGAEPPILEMIRLSGMPPQQFLKERIYRPLVRAYGYLAYAEGMLGEPHQQNVLFHIGRDGLPTGEITLRDLDAFHPDPVLRAMQRQTLQPFLDEQRPSKHLKFNKAQTFYNDSWESYVLVDWANLAYESLKQTEFSEDFRDRRALYTTLDSLLVEEITPILGVETVLGDSFRRVYGSHKRRLLELFPHVNWAEGEIPTSMADAKTLLDNFTLAELFPSRGRSMRTTRLPLQEMVDKFKAAREAPIVERSQPMLQKEYKRLAANFRATTRKGAPAGSKFELANGAILAWKPNGDLVGVAFLEPRTAGADFYAGITHPRAPPNANTAGVWSSIVRTLRRRLCRFEELAQR